VQGPKLGSLFVWTRGAACVYLGVDFGNFLSVDEDVLERERGLHDERQDGDEGEHEHLQQLQAAAALVGRVGGAHAALAAVRHVL